MSGIMKISSRIAAGKKRTQDTTLLGMMNTHMQESLINSGVSSKGEKIGSMMLSIENFTDREESDLKNSIAALESVIDETLAAVAVEGFSGIAYSPASKMAAVIGGALAGNVKQWLRHPITKSYAAEEFTSMVGMSSPLMVGGTDKRIPAYEAYDEKENRNVVTHTMNYNLNASRQNEFGELFFPTIVVSPDNIGFDISIRLVTIFDGDLKRNISGAVDDFHRRNVIHAAIDDTILATNVSQIVPVYRPESASNFVDPLVITPRDVLVGRETVTTSPIKVGAKYSLLGISSTPALIANGLLDTSDAIDPTVYVEAIYIKVGTGATADVLRFDTSGLATNNFFGAVQGQHRLMELSFRNRSLLINKDKRRVDNSSMVTLKPIIDNDNIVYLNFNMSGSTDLQVGTTEIFANRIGVESVRSDDGTPLSLTSGAGKVIADLFADAEILGYDLNAWRTNSNRRQRGDQLDTMYWNQRYSVPVLSPISVARPVNSDGSTDTADLGALITTTQVRTSNSAVKRLLDFASMLTQHIDSRDLSSEPPELLGVARHVLRPVIFNESLHVPGNLDSRTSHERMKDIQALVINKLRDLIYRMYIDSGFKATADAMHGGNSKTPTVLVGCDQELARYLQVDGDLRTVGPDFELKVVSTVNKRMNGTIVLAFGYPDNTNGEPNALHFGNMLWKPEATLVLPISRNGQISKELTVMPSYVHIVNCPVMSVLKVTGIRDVVASKVSVNMEIV